MFLFFQTADTEPANWNAKLHHFQKDKFSDVFSGIYSQYYPKIYHISSYPEQTGNI
jgi:hypothetical protein